MIEFDTEVLEVIQRTPTVKSFRFKVKEEISFKPGQFFLVTIKAGESERTKHFSFSSSPTEKGYVEFTKRLTDSEYSKALGKLSKGDRARLKMPLGNFTFEGEYKKIAFLTGGIGITPVRSICKFALDKKFDTDIVLIYSNKSAEDIAFRDDLDNMQAENKKMRIVYTLTSSEAEDGRPWQGRSGRIDTDMVKAEVPDFKERVFYISGPPAMVEAMSGLLEILGLQKDRVKVENFTGY